MESIGSLIKLPTPSTSPHKTRRASLIADLVVGINAERIGTKYKPTNERTVAIRANMCPFLVSDDELELLLTNCQAKGSYQWFWAVTK